MTNIKFTPNIRTDCNHTLGYAEGVDESWLVHKNSSMKSRDITWVEVWFDYCPMCGERLDIKEYIRKT